jgi:hypothetical protein
MPRLTPSTSRLAAGLLLAAGALAGCDRVDQLLTAETPSRLAADQLLVPQNAQLIVASAVTDYECALGAYVVASGLAAGELTETTNTASRWAFDRREVLATDAHYSTLNCQNLGVYTPVNTARFSADQALARLDGWTDQEVANRQRLIATAAAFAGYSMLLLAEGFCSGVIQGGPELQPAAIFDSAEVRFTRAIAAAQAAGDQQLLNLARVGRARSRIDRGNRAGAAEDAALVPLAFVYNAVGDANADRRSNRIFAQNGAGTLTTVAAAYRNLTVAGQPDPRVRVVNGNRLAGDQLNPFFLQQKYMALTSPTPIATGVEAQLILAEARGGAEGVAVLNALRARPGIALPALTAAEAADFTRALFEERRRELFLQGNRWFDLRRGNLPLDPLPGTPYVKGGSYGTQRCWPLPDVERLANPNLRP